MGEEAHSKGKEVAAERWKNLEKTKKGEREKHSREVHIRGRGAIRAKTERDQRTGFKRDPV